MNGGSRKISLYLQKYTMASKISNAIFESYLDCKYKGYLRFGGETGEMSDYDRLQTEARRTAQAAVIEKVLSQHAPNDVVRDVVLSTSELKKGAKYILNATLETDDLELRFDGLKRISAKSKLGNYHYVPVLVLPQRWKRREQKLFLAICAGFLADLQGTMPSKGIVFQGPEFRFISISLVTAFSAAKQLRQELSDITDSTLPPFLLLNKHCDVCEFRQRCHDQAVKEDNISLLRGMGEKETRRFVRRGINTVTRLAQTFRPRRKGKRQGLVNRRYHALQAMAVRDHTIYVLGPPEVRTSPVNIYVDIESVPEEDFVYLIGAIIVQDASENTLSFWANDKEGESKIFQQFLDALDSFDDFTVFAYGSFEKSFFTRMRNQAKGKRRVDRLLKSLVNTLSLVYSHIYFPTYSNGLKYIGRHLGFSWSDEKASGLQSIVWRRQWDSSAADALKEKITTYNLEDCAALKSVTDFVKGVSDHVQTEPDQIQNIESQAPFVWVQDVDALTRPKKWGPVNFFHTEFGFINKCAYFDYQRERVHVRTSKTIRRNVKKSQKERGYHVNAKLRCTQRIEIISAACPACKSRSVERGLKLREIKGDVVVLKRPRKKRAFDLVVTPSGIKRKVIECRTSLHQCRDCGDVFTPWRHERLATYFHGLQSWLMYQHVAHRTSMGILATMAGEFFGLQISSAEILTIKSLMARYYRTTYKNIQKKILSGDVIHSDETNVTLRTGKGYVWVIASLEEVVYMYRPNREGEFFQKMLEGFHGVLVSDFYSVYDSQNCPQQKCLIHLMRDMNQDLLNNPFDEELQSVTQPFGSLLRSVVETIDEHGLKRCHLKRHDRAIIRFFTGLENHSFQSEAAATLRERLIRNRNKLFTFVQYDGVPWNNNGAENAIKQFAYYRHKTKALMTENGLSDYLVLLSLYQSCRYKGVSFFKFLLSKERDIDAFCHGGRKKRRAEIEVYPKGFIPPHLASLRKREEKVKRKT